MYSLLLAHLQQSEHADNMEDAKAPMPILSHDMDAIDVLTWFAAAHKKI